MGGSSPAPQTQTTKHELSPEQQELLGLGLPSLREFAAANPNAANIVPPFSGVAGFDPMQTQGQNMVLGAAGPQQDIVGSAGKANQFLTSGDVLDPSTNPYMAKTIEAGIRPIREQLLEKALPSVRSGAVGSGQFGSSRQGIAEGQAIRGAETAAGDTAAKIASSGYTSGLDAFVKGLGLAPQTAQAQAIPGITTSGVGDVRQALAQQMLGEQTQRYGTNAMWPLLMGKEFAGMAGMLPGGTTTTTASGPQAPSGLSQALGFGAAGASALSSMLPLLMMSDRRTKRVVRKLRETLNGIPLYLFEYIGDTLPRVGVMADEVPVYARVRINGIEFVDYGAL